MTAPDPNQMIEPHQMIEPVEITPEVSPSRATPTSTTAPATRPSGLRDVPLALTELNRKDYTPTGEVRWCPGCGDYAILAAFQGLMPKLGIKRENTVIVSGIGCSSRFPYYLNTYGIHSIHGRAPALATGLAVTRPDLNVWVITGDGDALSIGGNHLIHALRRNVNITIVLFNNQIYGLTKGQYSPTSAAGSRTKSSPLGSVDAPFSPLSLALGAGATFVARTIDSNRAHLAATLTAAAEHRGAALVEVLQNCPIFNDGVFDGFKGPDADILPLVAGEPMIAGDRAVVRDGAALAVANDLSRALVHDLGDELTAFALSRLTSPLPIGVLRAAQRPTYDDATRTQVTTPPDRKAALTQLLRGNSAWVVE